MDRRKSILNISASVACKILLLIGSIILRRIFIKHMGLSLNGLNSLYISVIGILSVAELGIGSAISFSMYEPIVRGDKERVASLYRLFKKAYRIIGISVFLLGLIITPLLPYLVKNGENINADIYLSFVIFLLSVALSYTFNAKLSLINAYKNNYISTLIQSGGLLFQYGLQCAAILITKSFEWYLACGLVSGILQYFISYAAVEKIHKDVLSASPVELEPAEREGVKSNVRAMLMHKIGGALVNSTDSIIISAVIGIGVLGSYTNYAVIVNNVTAILTLAFTSLTSVVGHAFAISPKKAKEYFYKFYSANFVIGSVFFLGFYAICDYLVKLLFVAKISVKLRLARDARSALPEIGVAEFEAEYTHIKKIVNVFRKTVRMRYNGNAARLKYKLYHSLGRYRAVALSRCLFYLILKSQLI